MNSLGNRFLWVFTFIFRQKNKRTKELIEYSNVCSSELDVHLFIQCCALWCCVYDLFLLDKNKRGGCIRILKTEEHKNKRVH